MATYGQVARLAGLPGRARQVGYALHALAEGHPLPWHRVVGAGGRLSLMKLGLASGMNQRLRLEAEGVAFDARGRVRIEGFRWRPGAPLRARGRRRSQGGRRPRA